jgi:hypothetical protein
MEPIQVHKGRTTVITVSLGYDVSDDVFTSEIRVDKDPTSDLIATWDISFVTDGTDGELRLSLDDSATVEVTKSKGYMDIKRVTSGEPVAVFDDPLEVLFKNVVTV